MENDKRQIALIGGAFDPPTLGHLAIGHTIMQQIKTMDEIWFVPCHKHIFDKNMADTTKRVAMCRLMVGASNILSVSTVEITNKTNGSMYDTLNILNKIDLYDNCRFNCVIGMDNANEFHKWKHSDELADGSLCSFIVVPRKGCLPSPVVDWYLDPPHMLLDVDIPLISSTEVRELAHDFWHKPRIEMERNCFDSKVGKAVRRFIIKHKMYV